MQTNVSFGPLASQPASQPAGQPASQSASQPSPTKPSHPNFAFFPGEPTETSEPEPECGNAEACEPEKPERGSVGAGFHACPPTP